MNRTYADISHFRAPFKNWPYLGMGPGAASGIGAAPAPAPGPATAFDPATVIDTVEGVRQFKPVIADQIMKQLTTMSVVFLDNDNVKLDARTTGDIRESGDAWVKRKLGEGSTVIAGTAGGAQLFALPLVVERYLSAVKGHEAEVAATAGGAPLGAVLARPSLLSGLGKLGPIGMAAVALLVVGGVVMLTKKHKRGHGSHAVANRRRSRRRR